MLVKHPNLHQEVLDLLARAAYPRPDVQERLRKFYSSGQMREVFGWHVNGQVVCAMGVEHHRDSLEITHIGSSLENGGRGYGRALIMAVRLQMGVTVLTAQTDDNAVDFYRKCGFICTEMDSLYNTRRYQCLLTSNNLQRDSHIDDGID